MQIMNGNSNQPSIDDIVGQHQIIYDVYFSQADATGSGTIGAFDANNFLKLSKLKEDQLKTIWDLADPTGKGYLDRHGFYICLKLVALAQSSQAIQLENLNLPSSAPKLGELSSNITLLVSPDDPWYIKASARINFDKIFDSLSPINNKLSGARVKPFLMNSALPVDILGKIWELSDLDQDGQLDRDEFLIALQLLNKAKEGTPVPDQLPPSLLPVKVRHSSLPNASTGFIMGKGSVVSLPLNLSIVNETKPWIVTVEEKAKSDITFSQLDTDHDGFVTGLECKDIFLQTGLSQIILANIWNLCDVGTTGKLNSEQFALAMHFVNKKLATGLDVPHELLPEMVPPSLRPKPVLIEEAHASKEFEELQTQVTELQREKLYYEQRASEHDMITRQKRTELTNLELEMESLYKTLQEREINKSEEQKKLAENEEKLIKLSTQVAEFKEKYEIERDAIEKLKLQIQHMDTAMKSKDSELSKIKNDLKMASSEQNNLETKFTARNATLTELNTSLKIATEILAQNKSKLGLLKLLQENLNKLIKEYDKISSRNELSDEIRQLESENSKLNEEINIITKNSANDSYNSLNLTATSTNAFNNSNQFQANFSDAFGSPTTANAVTSNQFDKAFDAFDPFGASDPFQAVSNNTTKQTLNQSDPFSNKFDPFANNLAVESTTTTSTNGFGTDDPFSDGKKKPPRPAPPRPQTPSLKPTKKLNDMMSQRPQSALDFTMSTINSTANSSKFDAFADFNDQAFQINNSSNTKYDPFFSSNNNNNSQFDWNAFSSNSSSKPQGASQSQKDPFDPFA